MAQKILIGLWILLLIWQKNIGAAVTVLNVSESPAMGAVPLEPTTVSGDSMVVFAKDLRKFHEEILSKAVAHAKDG